MAAPVSAGILLFRKRGRDIEYFLVHPGGPFFKNKNHGWWTIPKGLPNGNETLFEAAKREFFEETGFIPSGEFIEIGSIKQKGSKTVHAWAIEGDLPENFVLKCNEFEIEWPPKSGILKTFPEVDEYGFFEYSEAIKRINPAQAAFIERVQSNFT